MFREAITATPMTSDVANSFFEGKILGENYRGDDSFLSTLRALIYPRMNDDECVRLYFRSSSYSTDVMSNSDGVIMDAIGPNTVLKGNITIHTFCGNADSRKEFIDFVSNKFLELHDGWYKIEKVTDFYRKVMDVVCFVNPEDKQVAIYCNDMDMRKMHYLQCGILAFMPWYFNKEDGITDLEMALIESLRMKTPQKYCECLEKIAEVYDFETERIKTLLAGFETRFEERNLEQRKSEVQDIIRRIESSKEQLMNYITQKRNTETIILGLEAKIAEGSKESEVMEYFLSNKKVYLIDSSNTRLRFAVKDYLEFYDPEAAENMIESERSFVYRPNGEDASGIIPHDDMKMLMKAIFVDQELKIKMCAAYTIDLLYGADGIIDYNFDYRFNDAIPNAHIQQYSCMGDYARAVADYIERNDYIGAIEQCLVSCKSLNFNDSPVMNIFMKDFYGRSSRNNKCIELPDGSVVRPKEAIEFLKEKKGEQTNE